MWATPSSCYLEIQPGCFYPWLQWSWTSWLHDWRQHLPMPSSPAQCSRSSFQVLSFQMIVLRWTCIMHPIAFSGEVWASRRFSSYPVRSAQILFDDIPLSNSSSLSVLTTASNVLTFSLDKFFEFLCRMAQISFSMPRTMLAVLLFSWDRAGSITG